MTQTHIPAISSIKPLLAENPIRQVWKELHRFLGESYVVDKIQSIQPIPQDQRRNVKKQAEQIGYCIRQAEEYFQASSHVGLPTRPLLLYYGSASLSQALYLLKKDGNYSIDRLRMERRHRNHGLDMVGELKFIENDSLESFYSRLQCRCHTNAGEPWGQFPLFYGALVPGVIQTLVKSTDYNIGEHYVTSIDSEYLIYTRLQECANLLPLDSLISQTFKILDLIKTLPDMYSDLEGQGITPDLCRGSLEVEFKGMVQRGIPRRILPDSEETFHFKIHQCSQEQKKALECLFSRNPNIRKTVDIESGMVLKFTHFINGNDNNYIFPSIVDDVSGNKFYIVKPDEYIVEPAAFYMILFVLGMLCRYSSDVWVKAIDNNVNIAEITDSFLNIAYRKFPNLILDQLTGVHYAPTLIER